MSYFSPFTILNPYMIQGRRTVGIDLTRRTMIPRSMKEDETTYFPYTIQDGETPEILADRLYDSADDYWIICAFNDIHDEENQWPLDYAQLQRMIDRVYGENKTDIHHYISAASGATVDNDWPEYDRVPITNEEHEVKLNEAKREIKLSLPEQIGLIKNLHKGR